MHKNGKWLFREHTSCSTGDGDGDGDGDCDGDGDGDGEGNGVDEGDGRGDGDGDDDADADGDGEVARSILGDSKGDEVTEDIEESWKKNVNQDHIIQKKLPYYYTARAKLRAERGVTKWLLITFKILKRTRFFISYTESSYCFFSILFVFGRRLVWLLLR